MLDSDLHFLTHKTAAQWDSRSAWAPALHHSSNMSPDRKPGGMQGLAFGVFLKKHSPVLSEV